MKPLLLVELLGAQFPAALGPENCHTFVLMYKHKLQVYLLLQERQKAVILSSMHVSKPAWANAHMQCGGNCWDVRLVTI